MNSVCVLVLAALLLGGCALSQDETRNTLEAHGFKNIQLGSWVFFGCGHGDGLSREFTATGANGAHVEGVVCGGWFGKGLTIRTFKITPPRR